MKNIKVLITGASIAGPTLAFWLERFGFEVTVLEKSASLRLGGQNIDVKGPAREIARKMGIENQIREKNTTEVGLHFVDQNNQTVAEFPKDSSLSMTQELEILRGDLVKILYDATKANVQYLFNDHITAIQDNENEVKITFASGHQAAYDFLIIAEGIGSQTRNLVFENQYSFRYLGIHTAYFTAKKSPSDTHWARWCNVPKGIVYLIRPDNYGTTRVSVNFTAEENQYRHLNLNQQKEALIQKIRGSGFESERMIAAIETADDLYFDRVSQVKAPHWSKGRIAMTGDAAYCATPISGKGIDLAMTGAYILAGEMMLAANHAHAFETYGKKMRPYVEKCQQLPPGIPKMVYPKTKTGIRILNTLISFAGSRFVKNVLKLSKGEEKKKQNEIDLQDYDHLFRKRA